MFQQSFGNGEVSSDRLANITAQHAVKERIAQVVGDGSIVLITAVQRGDEIKSFQTSPPQISYPLRSNTSQVGIDNHYRFGMIGQQIVEEILEIVPLSFHPGWCGEINLGNPAAIGCNESFFGSVLGTVVGINDPRAQMREVSLQPCSNLANHEIDVICLIVGWNSYSKI